MKKSIIFLLFFASTVSSAQTWTNNFKDYDASSWHHLNIVDGVNLCLPDQEFNCEFSVSGIKMNKSANLSIYISNTPCNAYCVVSVSDCGDNVFWKSFTLSSNSEWNPNTFETFIPRDVINGNRLSVYIWNPNRNRFSIDSVSIELAPVYQSFVPELTQKAVCTNGKVLAKTNYAQIVHSNIDNTIILCDKDRNPICLPISVLTQYIDNGDTLTIESNNWQPAYNRRYFNNFELTLVNDNSRCKTSLTINCNDWHFGLNCQVKTTFHKTTTLVRQSLIVPFVDDNFTVYRQNRKIDKDNLQDEYYIDTEGFEWNNDVCQLVVYHPKQLSSIQLNTNQNKAFLNIDYYLDHPLIQYPLSEDTSDYFVDCSAIRYRKGSHIHSDFDINIGWNTNPIPRIMALPNGFEAAFIWTEHADWTDIATHRAVNFGSAQITDIADATGGFAAHGIPVTKSVFYNNPDMVTNADNEGNTFSSPIATVRTDDCFHDFLKQLKNKGFEICLHTPDIYTATESNLNEALSFMETEFQPASWIDHGYNNGSSHNREDMVCDGLNAGTPHYALSSWKQHGIRYLWNPYFEEKRPFEQYCFDNNLMQPYPGSSDALPYKQFFELPDDNSFTCWTTASTLEVENDDLWDYYLSDARLMNLVEYRSVYIAHTYPSWTNPNRGFWTTGDDGTAVIKPQFESSLRRIAALRDKGLLIPCTVSYFLDYQNLLSNIRYEFTPEANIRITNSNNQTVEGLSIISATPLSFGDGKQFESKACGNETIYWFNLNPKEELTISY